MENREIEIRYLTNVDALVTFFEMSPLELKELLARYPFPNGQTLENCRMTPMQAADWYEVAMKQQTLDIGTAIAGILRPTI
ncbi:hypothetical protein ACFLZQ_05285 [Thermodesulfobacteriota bacterium]